MVDTYLPRRERRVKVRRRARLQRVVAVYRQDWIVVSREDPEPRQR
jgi:hypothetical protein